MPILDDKLLFTLKTVALLLIALLVRLLHKYGTTEDFGIWLGNVLAFTPSALSSCKYGFTIL